MDRLSGKRVVITGGTTGIGLATAQLFIAEGARVAITGQNAERLEEARRTLGADVLAIRADAGRVADAEAMVAEVGRAFGGIDVLFLNAGIAQFTPLAQVSEADFDAQFDVNVKGVLFTVQKADALLQSGASIIVTTSAANRIGLPGSAVYAATKAAARSLVRVLAAELAPRNIRVNAIAPGPIDTPILGKTGAPVEQQREMLAGMASNVPLGRHGQSEEIARVALFLANDDAAYVTGAEIVADGGWPAVTP